MISELQRLKDSEQARHKAVSASQYTSYQIELVHINGVVRRVQVSSREAIGAAIDELMRDAAQDDKYLCAERSFLNLRKQIEDDYCRLLQNPYAGKQK